MTPSARIQAAIDLWQKIDDARIPMDNICGDFFRMRRFIGSKDRADIAERVYAMMRAYARLGWWCGQTGMADTARGRVLLSFLLIDGKTLAALEALCNGRQYHPMPLSSQEKQALSKAEGQKLTHRDMLDSTRVECPEWAAERLKVLFGSAFEAEMTAMIPPAMLDIRVNTLKTSVAAAIESLAKDGIEATLCEYSPVGLRLTAKAFLSKTKAFTKGEIEIQDEGSQLLALICGAAPGMQVLDYCAGGGGKTLALASMMDNKGRIVAMDIDAKRLLKGKPRYKRAGVHNIETRGILEEQNKKWFRRQKGTFDAVLVDAPCSSSGTWRRNPDLRWRHFGPSHAEIEAMQKEILGRVEKTVKPGGRLVYATCSLFREENEAQVEAFLAGNPHFRLVPFPRVWRDAGLAAPCPVTGDYLRLTPLRHKTDGFFAAVMEKTAAA